MAAVSTTGCTGPSKLGGPLPGGEVAGLPVSLLPVPHSHPSAPTSPSLLGGPSPGVSVPGAPPVPGAFTEVSPKAPPHSEELGSCSSPQHRAEEAQGLSRVRASLRLSRSGKPRAHSPTGAPATRPLSPAVRALGPHLIILYLPELKCSHQRLRGQGLPCLETRPYNNQGPAHSRWSARIC